MLIIDSVDALPDLHRAAFIGDESALRAALATGISIDARANTTVEDYGPYYRGLTPLMMAAASDRASLAFLSLLLTLGADVQALSAGGVTALWYAAASGDVTHVQALLDAGADAAESSPYGASVLYQAAEAGDAQSIRILLAAGASPHPLGDPTAYATVNRYSIPLFGAAHSGNADCVRVFLDAGVSAAICDSNQQTALFSATSAAVVTVLVEAGCPLNSRGEFGHTALYEALIEDRADVVRALIAAGVPLEERDRHGYTLLAHLCQSMDVSAAMVQLLIDSGADVHARIYNDRTALHQASELWDGDRGSVLGDVVRILVAAGIPVDVRDGAECTPLHRAVGDEGTALSAVEALLDLGADVNATNAEGLTPLMVALRDGSPGKEVIRPLLAHGADVRYVTADGATAHAFAMRRVQIWQHIVAEKHAQQSIDTAQREEIWHKEDVLRETQDVLAIIEKALADLPE